jgi:hypothetical protein
MRTSAVLTTLSLVLFLCQSCTTNKLWEDTNPDTRLWIDADKITEAELQKRGVDYTVHNTSQGDGYLVEKSSRQKMKDFHLRMLGTPATLIVDAASTVAVVGVYVFLSDPEGTVALGGALRGKHPPPPR